MRTLVRRAKVSDMSGTAQVDINLLVEDDFTYMWSDQFNDMWKFTTSNLSRTSRYTRIINNAMKAFHSRIAGYTHQDLNQVKWVTNLEDHWEFEYSHIEHVDFETLYVQRVKSKKRIACLNTPFFSRDEMDWYHDPEAMADNYIFSDASYTNLPEPCSTYALWESGEVTIFDSEAESSVGAEVIALKHALKRAMELSADKDQKVIIYADCSPAIMHVILNKENTPYEKALGSSVFLHWLPGHRGFTGMRMVDEAARNHLRLRIT